MRRAIVALLAIVFCVGLWAQQTEGGARSSHTASPSGPIPQWSRIFIEPMPESFDHYLKAAIQENNVPVVLVSEPDQADFEISGSAESRKAGVAKILILGSWHSSEKASIVVTNRKNGTVVFAYRYRSWNSAHGKKSSADACARHLKKKIASGR